MSNNTSFYLGPYLEIKVKMIEKEFIRYGCENGHNTGGNFCSICGKPSGKRTVKKTVFPSRVESDILDESFKDQLSHITPPSLYQTGVILERSNTVSCEWLKLDKYNHLDGVKPFPTSAEVDRMCADFIEEHMEIIDHIRNSDCVVSAEIKSGYVLDCEY